MSLITKIFIVLICFSSSGFGYEIKSLSGSHAPRGSGRYSHAEHGYEKYASLLIFI